MIPYIINVALILSGCLVFYKLLLRKETFYRANRYILIICLVASFSLPLLKVPQQWSLRNPKEPTEIVQVTTPVTTPVTTTQQPPAQTGASIDQSTAQKASEATQDASISFSQVLTWMFWLYWFGVIAFGASFLLQMIILLWRAYRNPVIKDGVYRIVEVSGDKAPCSFGNNIFINPTKYDWDTYNQILEHEKVHIRERHTLDIVVAELVLIFQWFNPFAWIYRREIESNLEYLTDDQLIRQDIDRTSYQLSLMKVSAPHFPLSLTTNYNQSILKKRIAMMNTKRSNLHTVWKYFFLLPVLALLACLLNEPMAQGKGKDISKNRNVDKGFRSEGYWFAIIKEDKVNIRFTEDKKNGDDDQWSGSSSTFKLSDLSSVPKGSEGQFTITREAGRMDFTGKFDGSTGMGTYKFTPDAAYVEYMNKEMNEKLDEDDQIAFFFVDVKKSYLAMLRSAGYKTLGKDEVLPMAALKIDADYINSLKESGFKDIDMEQLIPLKALNIDANYIREIKSAGYKDVTTDQLITFKSQNIDKEYIVKLKASREKEGQQLEDPDDIVGYKAMNITDEYVNSFKSVGYSGIDRDDLVAMKSLGVTPEYIKSFQDVGYKSLKVDEIISFKSLGVSPEFISDFDKVGYRNLSVDQLTSFKALGVTPDFIRSFESVGYRTIDAEDVSGLKATGVTADFIKGFEAIGYKNVPLEEYTGIKATGVTPEYVKSMKEKGFNYDKLHKYVTLKTLD